MKKFRPKTLADAMEADRCRIELLLGRSLAPYEELDFTDISNSVGEFLERHPKLMMDYERDKFQFFLDKAHEYFARNGL